MRHAAEGLDEAADVAGWSCCRPMERERGAAIKRGEMGSAAGVVGIGERIKGEISY